jgi:hypothetical protein
VPLERVTTRKEAVEVMSPVANTMKRRTLRSRHQDMFREAEYIEDGTVWPEPLGKSLVGYVPAIHMQVDVVDEYLDRTHQREPLEDNAESLWDGE